METLLIISDLHFGKFFDTKFKNPDNLRKQIVDCLRESNIQPTFVLCPGDLTSIGDPKEFEEAKLFLEKLCEDLALGPKDLLALVGNHDVNRTIHDHLLSMPPGQINEQLARHLAAHTQANYHWPAFDIMGPSYCSGVIKRANYNLIALNSSWNCFNESKANGEIGRPQLEWLEALVQNNQIQEPCILTLHHHPEPLPFPTTLKNQIKDLSQTTDGQDLLQICESLDVHLIVHGHRHHPALIDICTKGSQQKLIPLLCAGSLSVEAKKRLNDTPNFFHVVEVDPTEQSNKVYTFNSTARGSWDSKYNPDFHESIRPISAIKTRCHIMATQDEIDHEFTMLMTKGRAISFETISPQLRCLDPKSLMEKIRSYASKNGLSLHGDFLNPSGVMIFNQAAA